MKLLRFLLPLLFFVGAPFAHAAIAYDSSSQGMSAASATSLTISQTIVSSSNTELFVTVFDNNNNTSVTWNGTSMTLLTSAVPPSGAFRLNTFYLLNPASGTHNIVITRPSGTNVIQATNVAYSGVAQSAPSNISNTTRTNDTVVTETLTTTTANAWTYMAGLSDNGGTISAGTGSTLRQSVSGNGQASLDSGGPIASPGSYSMTYSNTGTANYTTTMLEIDPYTAPATVPLFASIYGWF